MIKLLFSFSFYKKNFFDWIDSVKIIMLNNSNIVINIKIQIDKFILSMFTLFYYIHYIFFILFAASKLVSYYNNIIMTEI